MHSGTSISLAKPRVCLRQPEDKRRGKFELLAEMRAGHAALMAGRWQGYTGYDGWFTQVNNAALGMLPGYTELVPTSNICASSR